MRVVAPASGMSLRWKIPFAVLPVLAGIVIGVATAAYVQIKNAAIEADRSHLESASLEVAHLLEASLQRLRVDLRPLGSDARIVQALEGPSALDSARVSRALNDFRTQHAPRYIGVALCSVTGRVVAQVGVVPPDAIGDCRQHTTGPSAAATRVTPLRAHGDTITYSVRWWIESPSHGILGFLVAARSLGDPTTSAAIAKLVSLNANVLLGNVDGTLWTNFSKRVPGPPTSTPMDGGRHTHADGSEYVGAKSKVAGSPWAVWAESPTRVPIAMARAFVGEVLLVGLVLVVAGAVIVSWLVRRSLRPLDDVATAATALAYGAPTPVVPVGGPSELASLAHSFNTMANQVEASAQQLRTRADDLEVRNRELRESEGRYRQLVDQSPDGVVVHRDNTILFANRVIADLVGAEEPSRLFGRSVLDLVEPAHREEARRGVLAIRNSGQASKLTEMILQRLDGSTFTAEVNGTPIVFDGAPAIQTIARDITDRQQLEARVRHGQKLEAVGRLAGGIAHDFNNLLTIVLAHADLGLQRLQGNDTVRANLDAVQRAALSGSKLTRQLLAFSRKQVLSPRQLSINDTVTAAVGLLRRVIGDHVDVRPRLRPDLPSIWADAGQMEQVVINLAVNARDAMPDGGRLEIETDTAQVRETDDVARYLGIPPGEYVTLCVSDTGVGMTPEIQAQIFDPFFTTKALGHGTGLGLSTVYGIVKQSGGHVSVQSEPGRGSRFRFYFPLFSGEEAAIPTTSGEYPARANAAVKVLLVEDDPGVREALAGMLTFAGHAIVEAASPDAAVTLFREHRGRFDLVITDMMMPGMTGAELVRELQTSEPGLRAVIMSGYSETVTRDNWRLPPNVVFLEKPVAGASLLKAIRA